MATTTTYKDAGVNVREGERAVELMKEHVRKTFDANVLTGLGGFGSLFKLDLSGIETPVLVAGADGVGTKLKIAFLMDRHDTVGQDCVAMCVNDILCQGAKPLFFLDYIASSRVEAEKTAEIVKGMADGCAAAGCALVGGETAEMRGFYADGEYDLAGFAVGVADMNRIIDGREIREGDILIGVASSGAHSNGYSLIRKVLLDAAGLKLDARMPELGETLGENLLRPTKIYARVCEAVTREIKVKGMVHMTGGGFFGNIPRVLPAGMGASVRRDAWRVPPIFELIQRHGRVETQEMFATFNMGIGFVMIVSPEDESRALALIAGAGEDASVIGVVTAGDGVTLC